MEITLEKIELVKDRTGVSYKEAKEALEDAGGSVVDAIIGIEETIDQQDGVNVSEKGGAIVEKIKALVKKGNVSKIVIKNASGEELLNVPVNVGIVGAVIAPWGVIAAAIASFGFRCIIEVIKQDGSVIEVTDRTTDAVERASEKGTEVYEKVKNSETYEKVKEKTEETIEKASEALRNRLNKKDDDAFDDFDVDFDIEDDDDVENIEDFQDIKDVEDVEDIIEDKYEDVIGEDEEREGEK